MQKKLFADISYFAENNFFEVQTKKSVAKKGSSRDFGSVTSLKGMLKEFGYSQNRVIGDHKLLVCLKKLLRSFQITKIIIFILTSKNILIISPLQYQNSAINLFNMHTTKTK